MTSVSVFLPPSSPGAVLIRFDVEVSQLNLFNTDLPPERLWRKPRSDGGGRGEIVDFTFNSKWRGKKHVSLNMLLTSAVIFFGHFISAVIGCVDSFHIIVRSEQIPA